MPKNEGLYSKYVVRSTSGDAIDSGTFVLRPFNSDGSVRDAAAVAALRAYANSCEYEDLVAALHSWLDFPEQHDATKTLNTCQKACP